MVDRNKSQLTHDVTAAVMLYLDERGFKPVETEVGMPWCPENEGCRGWIADLAGVINPTQTELIGLGLLKKGLGWNELHGRDRNDSVVKAWHEKEDAWRAQRDRLLRVMTCLVEVKTSRSDFTGDRKWKMVHPVDLAYVAIPRGMVKPEEWPVGWGVMEYHEGAIKRLRAPVPQVTTVEQHRDVILSIAIRRDHRTRYAMHKEFSQAQRVRQGEEVTIRRVYEVTRALLEIARGERSTIQESLDRHRINKLPGFEMRQLQELYGIAKAPEQ